MSKAKNTTRRGARELAFQVLYGLSFTPAESRADLRRAFVLSPHNTAMDEQDLGSEPTGFAWELVEGVWGNSAALGHGHQPFFPQLAGGPYGPHRTDPAAPGRV